MVRTEVVKREGGHYAGEMENYDTGRKGFLDREEFRRACRDLAVKVDTDEEFEKLFNEVDDNKDGKISPGEFGPFYDYVKDFRSKVMESRVNKAVNQA
jgi:Ca2+-binding EF-hand superfamily protein